MTSNPGRRGKMVSLIAMGYREIAKNMWAKPVANNILLVNLETQKISLLFKDVKGKTSVWSSLKIDRDITTEQILYSEYAMLIGGIHGDALKDWSFLTKEDIANLIADGQDEALKTWTNTFNQEK